MDKRRMLVRQTMVRRSGWHRTPAIGPFAVVLMLVVSAVGAALANEDPAGPQQGPTDSHRAYLPMALVGPIPDVAPAQPSAQPPPRPTEAPTITTVPTETPTATATVIVCGALPARLRVTSIDVSPKSVKTSNARARVSAPIYLAPLPDGGAKVAWAAQDGAVHVTSVDSDDQAVAPDVMLPGDEVRGLVAHEDGGTGLLVVKGAVLSLLRFDAGGKQIFKSDLIGLAAQTVVGSKWVDSWGHEARLIWVDDRYYVYSGHTQFFGAKGKHQGDLLWAFDGGGKRLSTPGTGWDWGCSHSLDLRLAHNGTRLGPVCLSDAYPKPGFHFNHSTTQIRAEPSGDGSGGSDARLGGWVPLRDGFLMSFASPEGRRSTDVGLVKVGNDGRVGALHWLTDSDKVTEDGPHLARYGRDRFLATWMEGSDLLAASIDEAGTLREGPVQLAAAIAARDDLQTMPDGDVAWAAAWDDFSRLRVVRVDACGSLSAATALPPTAVPTSVPPTAAPTSRIPTTVPTAGPTPTPTVVAPAEPQECRSLLTNGDFESGMTDWTYTGEAGVGSSDHGGGRYGAKLLGRNGVMAELRRSVVIPAGTVSAHLRYWWKMTSSEAVAGKDPYDWVTVAIEGGSSPLMLEQISNLAGRGVWLPSGYAFQPGGAATIIFRAQSNKRDSTTVVIDDIQLVICTGSPASFPNLRVEPRSGPPGSVFQGTGDGFKAGEAVSHWLLEPVSLVRRELTTGPASTDGSVSVPIKVGDAPGAWRWGAVGAETLLPASVSLDVTAAMATR